MATFTKLKSGSGALRFGAKENMSTSRFSAAATRRNGRWTSSAGVIAVNSPTNRARRNAKTFGDLVRLHRENLQARRCIRK